MRVADVAFDEAGGFAPVDHARFGGNNTVADRTKEINFEFKRCHRFAVGERTEEGDAHGVVGQVAVYATVQGSGWIVHGGGDGHGDAREARFEMIDGHAEGGGDAKWAGGGEAIAVEVVKFCHMVA